MSERDKMIAKAVVCIDRLVQDSVSEVITLSSVELEDAGVKLENQIFVLDTLTNAYQAMRYTFEWPYKDIEQLSQETIEHLSSGVAVSQVHPNYLVYKYLSQKNYIISVLPAFSIYAKHAKANLPLSAKDIVASNAQYSAIVTMQGNQLFAELRAGLRAPIGPPLQYGRTPYNFMHYLFAHPFQTINIHDVQEKVEGCATKTDLTELVRYCHFDKFLKSIFFERTSKSQVRFTPWRYLKNHEISEYVSTIDKLLMQAAKHRKKR